MNTTKSLIRNRLKTERQKLDRANAFKWSEKIVTSCIELIHWEDIKSLHTYVPVLKEHEADVRLILEYAWSKYPNIQTVVPVLNSVGNYDSVVVSSKTEWTTQGVRIPEPKNGEILANSSNFDVIIVPMLGFDDAGYRLGHGKGWYDRFLTKQPNAQTIGVCYEIGYVAKGLPHEPHDIPLAHIATEKSVRTF